MDALPVAIYCAAVLAWLWGIHHLRPERPSPLATSVHRPSVDGNAAPGAGTPDPAPGAAPHRVHIEMGGRGRRSKAA